MKNKNIIWFAFVIFVILNVDASTGGTTRTVCPSGCDYSTIQSAINAVSSGDTVYVRNGTYIENVKITKDSITLQGENRDTTIIHGGWYSDTVDVTANGVNINGFTITKSGSGSSGIKLESDNNVVNNNKIW